MPLAQGDDAPPFSAPDQHGAVVTSDGLRGTRYVLYFYPKDETPICTKEACGFRDGMEAFNALGVPVFGVSHDTVESHARFARRHRLTFRLLADPDRSLIRAFGADGLLGRTTRVTFVIGPQGRIEGVRRHELSGKGHATWAADLVARLSASPPAR